MVQVRLGYFTEAQPFQVACARGWFDLSGYKLSCLPQSSGGYAASKLDDGDLHMAVLGSTPYALALARGVKISGIYTVHSKGDSQGLVMRNVMAPHLLTHNMTVAGSKRVDRTLPHALPDGVVLGAAEARLYMSPSGIVAAWDAGTSIDGAFCWGGVGAARTSTCAARAI
eukprot:3274875-Prymnesium_polylepis.1